MRVLFILFLVLLPAAAQEHPRHVLTNEGVVTLAKAGFDELFIIDRIRTSRTQFDITVESLVALKQAGLSEDLIRAMALTDPHSCPAPAAAPPAEPQPEIRIEKHWWGYRVRTTG
jgi:hypothetical protein